jgi:hypothetical protein
MQLGKFYTKLDPSCNKIVKSVSRHGSMLNLAWAHQRGERIKFLVIG